MNKYIKIFVLFLLTSTVCESKAYRRTSVHSQKGRVWLGKINFRAKRQSPEVSEEPNEAPSKEFFSNPYSSPLLVSRGSYGSTHDSDVYGASSSTNNDYSQPSIESSFPDKIPYAKLADPSVKKKPVTSTSYSSQSSGTGGSSSYKPASHSNLYTDSNGAGSSSSSQYPTYGQYGSSSNNPSGMSPEVNPYFSSSYGGNAQNMYPQRGSPYQSNPQSMAPYQTGQQYGQTQLGYNSQAYGQSNTRPLGDQSALGYQNGYGATGTAMGGGGYGGTYGQNSYGQSSNRQQPLYPNPRSMYLNTFANYGARGSGYTAGSYGYDEAGGGGGAGGGGSYHNPYQSGTSQTAGQSGGRGTDIRVGSSSTRFYGGGSDPNARSSSYYTSGTSSDSSTGGGYSSRGEYTGMPQNDQSSGYLYGSNSQSGNQYQTSPSILPLTSGGSSQNNPSFPYNPSGTGQYNPSGSSQYNPYQSSQYNSGGSNRYNPYESSQYNPPGSSQYNQGGSNQYSPYRPSSQNPYGSSQYSQSGSSQYNPYKQSQYNPATSGQYNPSGSNQYGSYGSNPYNTPGSSQYNPAGTGQYNSYGSSQYNPSSSSQYNPYSASQYNPSGSSRNDQYNPARTGQSYSGGTNPYRQGGVGQHSRPSSANTFSQTGQSGSNQYSQQGASQNRPGHYGSAGEHRKGSLVSNVETGDEEPYVAAGAGREITKESKYTIPENTKTSLPTSEQYYSNSQQYNYGSGRSYGSSNYDNTQRQQSLSPTKGTSSYLPNNPNNDNNYNSYQTNNHYSQNSGSRPMSVAKTSSQQLHNSRGFGISSSSRDILPSQESLPGHARNIPSSEREANRDSVVTGAEQYNTNSEDTRLSDQSRFTSDSQQGQYSQTYYGGSLYSEGDTQSSPENSKEATQYYSSHVVEDNQPVGGPKKSGQTVSNNQWSDTTISEDDTPAVYQPDPNSYYPYLINDEKTSQQESSSEDNTDQYYTGNMGGFSNRGVPYDTIGGYQNPDNTQQGSQESGSFSYNSGISLVNRIQPEQGNYQTNGPIESDSSASSDISPPTLSRNRGRLVNQYPIEVESDPVESGDNDQSPGESYLPGSETTNNNNYPNYFYNSPNSNDQTQPETVYRPAIVFTNNQEQPDPVSTGTTETTGLPDLKLNKRKLMTSFLLDQQKVSSLKCARGVGCLSPSANNAADSSFRKLLKFETTVKNEGTATFLPDKRKEQWIWHTCHNHSHSMDVFSHYDLIDVNRRTVAQGHKASFCLEDSKCDRGITPTYDCEKGTQGISSGCEDTYKASVDCQWIDVTDVELGKYKFSVRINPDRLITESDYTNNGVECEVRLMESIANIWGCKYVTV